MTIGEKMKQIRKEKGMTVAEVAYAAGVSKQRVSTLENDAAGIPTLPTIQMMASGLQCSVFDIIDEPLGRYYDAPICNPNTSNPCKNAKQCPFFKPCKIIK